MWAITPNRDSQPHAARRSSRTAVARDILHPPNLMRQKCAPLLIATRHVRSLRRVYQHKPTSWLILSTGRARCKKVLLISCPK